MLFRPWTRPVPARAARRSGAGAASAPSCTSAPAGAVSSAKPARPSTASGPETWYERPSSWARHDASTGSRLARSEASGRALGPSCRRACCAERGQRRLDDRLPPGAAAQVRPERGLDLVATGRASTLPRLASLEGDEAHEDPRRAEPALAGPGTNEGVGPAVTLLGGKPFEGGDPAPGDAAHRGDARDPGRPVDPDGAAAALALWAAPVLDRMAAELVAQRVEEGDAVPDVDRIPVQDEGDVGTREASDVDPLRPAGPEQPGTRDGGAILAGAAQGTRCRELS